MILSAFPRFFVYTMVSKINDVFWIFVQVLFGISSVEAIVTNQRIVFLVFCIFYSLCLVIVIVTKNLFSSLDVSKSIMFEIRTKELIVSYFLLCKKKYGEISFFYGDMWKKDFSLIKITIVKPLLSNYLSMNRNDAKMQWMCKSDSMSIIFTLYLFH